MVIDTSALFAIEFGEAEREVFDTVIRRAGVRLISAATAVECATVFVGRRPGADGLEIIDSHIKSLDLTVVPVDEKQWRLAAQAMLIYGKGRHAARLNFGDSFAYALAKATGEPLLFKGADFSQTDLVAVTTP